jgi:hypothetical protein
MVNASEADKALADLEEHHKKEVTQLLIANREQAVNANRLRDSMEQAIRLQKYKRCKALAFACAYKMQGLLLADPDYAEWLAKWRDRWLRLADAFKGTCGGK